MDVVTVMKHCVRVNCVNSSLRYDVSISVRPSFAEPSFISPGVSVRRRRINRISSVAVVESSVNWRPYHPPSSYFFFGTTRSATHHYHHSAVHRYQLPSITRCNGKAQHGMMHAFIRMQICKINGQWLVFESAISCLTHSLIFSPYKRHCNEFTPLGIPRLQWLRQ